MKRTLLSMALLLALAGCATAPQVDPLHAEAAVADRLFFGRNIPAGGTVGEAEWETFLREVVTPRFPEGLTVWSGRGQWLDPRGAIVREEVFVVEVFHPRSDAAERALGEIAEEYRRRFGQDAVLRVTGAVEMRLYSK